jgi:hypothetical protein
MYREKMEEKSLVVTNLGSEAGTRSLITVGYRSIMEGTSMKMGCFPA